MAPVRVKICGLTRPEDASWAAELGASWLGVVFAGGPRLVTPARAREIVAAVRGKPVFGVFGSQQADEILRLRDASGLAGAQLHGAHSPELTLRLRTEGMLLLEVAHLAGATDLDSLDQLCRLEVPVLVEPKVGGALGGTGVTLSLELAQQARVRLAGATMVLAGGLSPDNVAAAIARVHPDAVDVSSGVEQIPGVKDPDRIARFMEAVGGHNAAA
jgi:phosphoribosylanthranilate isomerase